MADNLNTHNLSIRYDTFEPAYASRLAMRTKVQFKFKLGSWLIMAEIEINVLSRQRLDRRIPYRTAMILEVAAWQEHTPLPRNPSTGGSGLKTHTSCRSRNTH